MFIFSVCLNGDIFICLSTCVWMYFYCLSVYLYGFMFMSVCLAVCLSICVSVSLYMSLYLCVCLFFFLFRFLCLFLILFFHGFFVCLRHSVRLCPCLSIPSNVEER